jgi:putative ABC transport system permease protein
MVGGIMKIENKLLLRKIKKQLPQVLSAALIVAIGVGFFVTLKTVLYQYQKMSEQYFKDYSLADYTVYGTGLDKNDVEKVSGIEGVKTVHGRFVSDFKSGDATMRVISTSLKGNLINKPYMYEGRFIENDTECLLLKKYADAHGLKINESVGFKIKNEVHNFKIVGLIATPEYVYLAQSESVPMADPQNFGVLFISENYIKARLGLKFNQLNIIFDNGKDKSEVAEEIKNALKPKIISYDLFKSEQISYKMYKEDQKQIDSFAYIFPVVFFIIGAMMIYVMQKRNIAKERKQIGIIKALGLSDSKILFIYTKYALIISFLGSIGGCLLSVSLGNYILDVFGEMFEIPGMAFKLYPDLWGTAFLIASTVCILSNFIGIKTVLKINPAEAMHAEKPKGGKKILLEYIKPVWGGLSFNTRYALKASLRNKGRFLAAVMGMTAAVALAVFALGFDNSFKHLINKHYGQVIKYDISVTTETTPLENNIDILSLPGVEEYAKALTIPVIVEKGGEKHDYPLLITETSFNMLDLKNDKNDLINKKDGIVLPAYVANKIGVNKGDRVKISSPSGSFESIEVLVSDMSIQGSSFYVYTSYGFVKDKFISGKMVYNTVFIRTNGDVKELLLRINDSKNVIGTASTEQDKNTLLKLLNTISFMIQIIIVFAIVLGVAVLYAVGIINLTDRSYEFIVLKVMGYDTRDITFAYLKESFLQMIISLPLGFVLGNLLLLGIRDEFSNDSFALTPYIYTQSYLFAALLLIVISAFVMLLCIRVINRLDIVEGLKAREE